MVQRDDKTNILEGFVYYYHLTGQRPARLYMFQTVMSSFTLHAIHNVDILARAIRFSLCLVLQLVML